MTLFKSKYTPQFTDVFILLYKEAFDVVARGITDPAYGPDKLNEYIKSITQSNPIQ
jgi:hypothetical protein